MIPFNQREWESERAHDNVTRLIECQHDMTVESGKRKEIDLEPLIFLSTDGEMFRFNISWEQFNKICYC